MACTNNLSQGVVSDLKLDADDVVQLKHGHSPHKVASSSQKLKPPLKTKLRCQPTPTPRRLRTWWRCGRRAALPCDCEGEEPATSRDRDDKKDEDHLNATLLQRSNVFVSY